MARVNFFALEKDLLSVLAAIESSRPVKYTRAGTHVGSVSEVWHLASELPNIGNASDDQAIGCDAFLLMDRTENIHVRPEADCVGKQRFTVDQILNPDSIVLSPGGLWSKDVIISGSFATVSTSSIAKALMRTALLNVKKQFTHINAFWVGPAALIALRSGKRLTYAVQLHRNSTCTR